MRKRNSWLFVSLCGQVALAAKPHHVSSPRTLGGEAHGANLRPSSHLFKLDGAGMRRRSRAKRDFLSLSRNACTSCNLGRKNFIHLCKALGNNKHQSSVVSAGSCVQSEAPAILQFTFNCVPASPLFLDPIDLTAGVCSAMNPHALYFLNLHPA